MAMKTRAVVAGMVGALALAATAGTAEAQQSTFKLDRLEVPGGPEDGMTIFRPQTNQRTIFWGQLGVGYQLRPLRTETITNNQTVLDRSHSAVIENQLAVYGNAGFDLFDRFTVALAFPWYPEQDGNNPVYSTAGGVPLPGVGKTSTVVTGGPGAGDIRLDLRGVILRSEDRNSALGASVNIFFPSGSNSNFGSDGKTAVMAMVTGETKVKFLVLTANTGLVFRPDNSLNDPNVNANGLGVGNEWRWAVGAFIPLKDGKYRLGGSIFGQTGIENNDTIGNTVFTKRNTPVEFNLEGRMRFGGADHWWLGAGAGSSILRGYGAPDLRVLAMLGVYIPILDSNATSPEKKIAVRHHEVSTADRDHDGIPDDIDACPDEPEDHLGNDPNDGCPMPKDRDGDGIPDQFDKCPDQPEDKDGVDDGDGCPEDDVDNDGVPDATDACPRVPGKPNKDPKKNGCPTTIEVDAEGGIRVLQQVHFETGTAKLLPDSFSVLQEVADYLKVTPGIKRMSVDGHTDNTGSAAINKTLSQQRAETCMNWLTAHGVAADRLEAHGFGPDKPVAENTTAEGRAKNRRTEFNIIKQESK